MVRSWQVGGGNTIDITPKTQLSESDICTKYITPALVSAGWDIHAQIRQEVTFTDGEILVRGRRTRRGARKRADYVLFKQANIPLAVIEAKDNNHSIGAGMQQALSYAERLDVPFVYSSNGDGFLEHDRSATHGTVERELSLDEFPSPEDLWARYKAARGLTEAAEPVATQPYHVDVSGKEPRYYQRVAINRVIEAIARGQERLLLVMATGTGKTYTAFQVIWRLWKAGKKKRVLFLADRNILIDQAKTNDFKPFGGAMTKIRERTADPAYEIHLALYQQMTGPELADKTYRKFSPDFFDLIVIDECHRGSARQDSEWREILDYFKSATQLGLTATPKETEYASNIDYFGDPVYTYSLRQGIEDGFLAPFKVFRLNLDKDFGWRPSKGQRDRYGEEIEDREYNVKDMDRTLVLEERTKVVAKRVTEFLKKNDRLAKTIVFCEDIDHAERMRQALVNENADMVQQNHRYVMRITGDSPEGKAELDNFILPDVTHPVIVTTSQLLTTGVDAQTCKLIVLDRSIESMTEFKQIIGRGTRINEDYDKRFFTIIDFRGATKLFADPSFDGPPIQDENFEPTDPLPNPDDETEAGFTDAEGGEGDDSTSGSDAGGTSGEPRRKYYVAGVPVTVVAERIQYYDSNGRLVTESIKDYTSQRVNQRYESLDAFLQTWSEADQKQAIIRELERHGVIWEALRDEFGGDYDPFDLILHVVFDRPPLTRRERVELVKKRDAFSRYQGTARKVLDGLLELYADQGIEEIEAADILRVKPISDHGSVIEIVGCFGGVSGYRAALQELERQIYDQD